MIRRDIRFEELPYTVAEATRVIVVPSSTLATWTKGYVRDRADRPTVIGEAVVRAFPAEGRAPSIPFIGLAEAMVLAALRRSGVANARVFVDVVRERLKRIELGTDGYATLLRVPGYRGEVADIEDALRAASRRAA